MGRLFLADGTAQDEAFALVRTHDTMDCPSWFAAAMDADGDFVIAWSEYNEDLTICHFMAQRFVQPKAWTVMVYMDGDNNLEGAAIDDFLEMARVHNSDVNVVVQFDRVEGYDAGYGDWKTTERFIMWEGITPEPQYALSDLGEKNMGAPGTLESFIDWARDKYPAEHYALILWDHGGGWKGGVCNDDHPNDPNARRGDFLDMSELRQALGSTAPFDVIGMDACLMGELEVAYEIKDYADFFVASAERIPGYGWDYASILRPSDLGFSVSAETWAEGLVASYGTYYTQHPQEWLRNQTLMGANLDYIGFLAEQVSGLADVLMANLASERTHIADAWNASRHYSDDPLSLYYQDYLDLYDFCDELKARSSNAVIQWQAGTVMSTIWPILLDSYWKLSEYKGTTEGQRCLSIYFPPDKADCGFADYDELHLSFLKDTNQHWDEFLAAYFALPPVAQGWQGSVGSDWNDPGNWSAGINPGPQVIAEFNAPTDEQPVISRDTTIMGVSLEAPGWTIGGTGKMLSVGKGGIDSAGDGTNTVDPNVGMGTDSAWTVGDENTLVLNGTFGGGDNTLTKDGAGRLVFAGGQDHTTGLAMNVGAGTVQVAPAAGPIVLSSLCIAESGGAPTARLDLASGRLIVDYDDGAASPLASIKRWLAAGYNTMTWTGNGIVSSAAAPDPITFGLGYAQNDMLFAPYDSFAGQPVDLSTILVKFTYLGDLNLDGCVDDNDVTFLNLFYDGGITTSHYWSQGDIWGYDGRVDDNDVTILGLTYGLGIGHPLGGAEPSGISPAPLSEAAEQPLTAAAPTMLPGAAVQLSIVAMAREADAPDASGPAPDGALSESVVASGNQNQAGAGSAPSESTFTSSPAASLEVAATPPPLAWASATAGPAGAGETVDLLSQPALEVLSAA